MSARDLRQGWWLRPQVDQPARNEQRDQASGQNPAPATHSVCRRSHGFGRDNRCAHGCKTSLLRRLCFNRTDKPIPALGQSFNVARSVGLVSQGLTKFLYRRVQAVIEINKRVSGPEALLDLLASDQLSGPCQQHFEDLDWLALQPQPDVVLAQLSALTVQLEGAETKCLFPFHGHNTPPSQASIVESPTDYPTPAGAFLGSCGGHWVHVGTAALGCPVERSSTSLSPTPRAQPRGVLFRRTDRAGKLETQSSPS